MKIQIAALTLIGALSVAAQDKVTVPLSNASQPVTVKVHLMHGSIVVTAGGAGQVVVESVSTGRESRNSRDVPPGMKRIDNGRSGLDIEEDHNVVSISAMRGNGGNLNIVVPANASLNLKTLNGGNIEVTGVTGEIEVDNLNGPINLKNVSGSVVAHSLNGNVTASVDRVAADKPMAFTSMNGKIDVTLPGEVKARARMKTDHGEIYSDFDMKVESDVKPQVQDNRNQGGKYRIKMDHSIYGSINGGGARIPLRDDERQQS